MSDAVASRPEPVHTRAANGDGAASREIAAWHSRLADDGIEPPVAAYACEVIYTRMAAMQRTERDDWVAYVTALEKYANALREIGFEARADAADGEAFAAVEAMAFLGDETASQLVVTAADSLSPAVMREAQARVEAFHLAMKDKES